MVDRLRLRKRLPVRRWVVRMYERPSGRADYLFTTARSERDATRDVAHFIAFVERIGIEADLAAEIVPGPPKWGDLGATPAGKEKQVVSEIRRWSQGGEPPTDADSNRHPWPDEDDLQVIADWRQRHRFDP
ncbi:hypothetical protein [Blastococcus deserti]|uniref:Uncharacterized protein n=1 Tax=Blastococcus deserti TaxID=2259033 RepID=A0ABW4X9D0_9ACTN